MEKGPRSIPVGTRRHYYVMCPLGYWYEALVIAAVTSEALMSSVPFY